ncbi:CPBP family intramembrane glutamic endopeptidase [uncultured Ruminococcus sp.]|uniref:CPBP family intramembrane glutamic endopeptidase n=1 Tax=uncultured Ruminococcus sp. TaxID=165186 RepID=UPI000EDC22FF|nr:CPBP family intramembrane glutamic endopeptidase [uncultured Ruminococcus sp.]HCJ40521.1 hypothetical protein [Ruminococcus sp.]
MKELFEKDQLKFAVSLIIVYTVGMIAAAIISKAAGMPGFFEVMFAAALCRHITSFARDNKITEYAGMCIPKKPAKEFLYYIPLYLTAVLPLIFGAEYSGKASDLTFLLLKMLMTGILEVLIFTGFLYKAIKQHSDTLAVVISAVTLGIWNSAFLFYSKGIFEMLINMICAVAVGSALVFIFRRTGSLIHCLLFLGLNDLLSVFPTYSLLAKPAGSEHKALMIVTAVRTVIIIGYIIYICKKTVPLKDGTPSRKKRTA